MTTTRRNIFALAAAASAGLFGWRAAAASAAPSPADMPRVVYHLADLEKIDFVLGNIDNHIKGMGGADQLRIALVVHGPALLGFKTDRASKERAKHLAELAAKDVDLGACGNTLDAQKLTVADLLPGFSRINEGGVTRLATLQWEGYAYIRP